MDGFSLTKSTESVETITFVPASHCFIHLAERPAGIEGQELAEFAELTLEALSPFPIEQLAWGYLCGANDDCLLLYAAYKPRLNNDNIAPFPQSGYVLPVFAALYPLKIHAPTLFFIHYPGELSAVYASPEVPVPIWVESRTLEAEEDNIEAIFHARSRLIESLCPDQSWYVDHGVIQLNSGETYTDGSAGFHFNRLENPEAEPEILAINHNSHTDVLWQADMREETFIQAEIQRRRTAQRLWLAMRAGAVAAGLILALQVGTLVSGSLLSNREDKITRTAEAVNHVKERHAMLITLKGFSTEALQPIAALSTLDRYRPPEIWFRSLSGTSGNVMQIKGIAPSNSSLNRYTDILRKTNTFEYVNVPDFATKSGKVDFTLELKYSPQATEPEAATLAASAE